MRELIRERVAVGTGGSTGSGQAPRTTAISGDAEKVAALRAQGISWREIAARLGVGIGTVHRVARERSKSPFACCSRKRLTIVQ